MKFSLGGRIIETKRKKGVLHLRHELRISHILTVKSTSVSNKTSVVGCLGQVYIQELLSSMASTNG